MKNNGVRLCFSGNAERILNLVYCAGISVRKVERRDDGVSFFIKSADFPRVKVLSERYALSYQVEKDGRIKTLLRQNALRIGLYLGTALFIAAYVLYATFLTRVKITGNERTDTAVIMAIVEKYCPLPTKKGDVDVKSLQNEVAKCDGIANASVYVEGNILRVEVYEELEKAELFDRTDYADVLSKYDATVTRVIPYDGTPQVKNGDVVRSGDVLLSSVVYLDEEKTLSYQTRPFGEVYGVVRFTKEVVFADTIYKEIRTGNSASFSSFFVERAFSSPYPLFETEKKTYYLYNVFPVKTFVTTYYELEKIVENRDILSDIEGVVKTEREIFFSELPQQKTVTDFSYEIKRLDKSTLISLYYDIEIKIS